MRRTDMTVVEDCRSNVSGQRALRRKARRKSTVATLILEPR
jgi:hypothetical protein